MDWCKVQRSHWARFFISHPSLLLGVHAPTSFSLQLAPVCLVVVGDDD